MSGSSVATVRSLRVPALAIACLASCVAIASADVRFASPYRNFEAGPSVDAGTHQIAIADLDGDHTPDLVGVTEGANCVVALTGVGDGTYGVARTFATGAAPMAFALGEVNADGNVDLVTTNKAVNTVSVLLGDGHGGFLPKVDYAVGTLPLSVAIGDVDGDGWADLVTANAGANSISVLLGRAGRFGPKTDFAAGVVPQAIALADLNGDGALDAVTANASSLTLAVMLGAGDGTFGVRRDYGYSSNGAASRIVIADVDGDGKLDAVTTSNSSAAAVSYGKGDGRFGSRYAYGAGLASAGLAVGDVTGDGRPDLLVSSGWSLVSVLRNTGSGVPSSAFAVDTPLFSCMYPEGVAIGDLNLDGKPDLAATSGSSGMVVAMLGNGDGTFGHWRTHAAAPAPGWLAKGDFSTDGIHDLISMGTYSSFAIQIGRADGTYGPPTEYTTTYYPAGVAIGDFNQDGRKDLAVASAVVDPNSLQIFRGQGNGTFASPFGVAPGGGAYGVAAGDLNGDHRDDLVTWGPEAVYLGAGAFLFGSAMPISSRGSFHSTLADLDGDGHLDLVQAVRWYGFVTVMFGHGDGTFGPAQNYGSTGFPNHVDVLDLDGDGRLDIAATNEDGTVTELLQLPAQATDVAPGASPALASGLGAAPNPSRASTTLSFTLAAPGAVTIEILDVAGRRTRVLAERTAFAAGAHQLTWDGLDAAGRRAGDGVYFARFVAGERRAMQRIVLLH